MILSFWQLIALQVLLGSILAFGFAWFVKKQSHAYLLGLSASLMMVLLPACTPMLQTNSVAANKAAEEFFWVLFPSLVVCLVSAIIAIGFARMIRWKD